jgi:hypothetical protein
LSARLASILDGFGANLSRVRLLSGVLSTLDGDGRLASKGGVSGLCAEPPSVPSTDGVANAGQPIAEVAENLDSGERYAGVATPARTALSLYDAHVDWSPGIQDIEDEHGRDAVMRLVGLGLVAEGLSEDSSDVSADAWLGTESGRASLSWFAAVEIVLAFSTEDEVIDGDKLLDLLDTFFDAAIEDWAELVGDTALARARIIVNNWTDVLCPAITAAGSQVTHIAAAVRLALGEGGDLEALTAEAEGIALYQSLVARHLGETLGGGLTEQPAVSVAPEPVEEGPAEEEPELAEPAEEEPGDDVPIEEQTTDGVPEVVEPAEKELVDEVPAEEELATEEPAAAPHTEQRAHIEQELVRATAVLADRCGAMASVQVASAAVCERLLKMDGTIALDADGLEKAKATLSTVREERSLHQDGGKGDLVALEDYRTAAQVAGQTLQIAEASVKEAIKYRNASVLEHKSAEEFVTTSRVLVLSMKGAHIAGVHEQRRCSSALLPHRQKLVEMLDQSAVVVAKRLEGITVQRTQLKTSLASMRKERRGLGQSTATTSRQETVLQEEMDVLMAVIDASRRETRRARDHATGREGALQTSETSHDKRVQRLQALETRESDADAKVNSISAQISESRAELDELVAVITVRRSEQEAVLQEQLVKLRKEKRVVEERLISDRDRLPLLKAATKEMRAQITAVIGSEREAVAARDEAAVRLDVARSQHVQNENLRTHEADLAVAALDMLKAKAKRLEEAHTVFSSAQGVLDGLYKELKLAGSQRESLDREIETCREGEAQAQHAIEVFQEETVSIEAGIKRNIQALVKAKEQIEQDRLTRTQEIHSQLDVVRAQTDGLRSQWLDAQEDLKGLSAAESRVHAAHEAIQVERKAVVEDQSSLDVQQRQILNRQAATERLIKDRESTIGGLAAVITGSGFTIQGLVADRDVRTKRITQTMGRIEHLKNGAVRVRVAEDAAVEKVADFQSWVDRTKSALERCAAAIAETTHAQPARRPIPKPPVVPTSGSKVDRLLAGLKPPNKRLTPEVDANATMVAGRASLIAQAEADAAATRILSRSSIKQEVKQDEDATVIYSPEELRQRLLADEEPASQDDATMIVRRPVKASESEGE